MLSHSALVDLRLLMRRCQQATGVDSPFGGLVRFLILFNLLFGSLSTLSYACLCVSSRWCVSGIWGRYTTTDHTLLKHLRFIYCWMLVLQCPPVSGTSLITALLNKHNVYYPRRILDDTTKPQAADRCQKGAELFEMLTIIYLTIQQRAEDCPYQMQLIERLQSGRFKFTSTERGLCAHVLTRQDVIDDPTWISDAVVLVRVI